MSGDVAERLAQIRARAEAASRGPWATDGPHWWDEDDCTDMVTTDPARLAVAVMPPADTGLAPAAGGRTGNARFIAGARSDVPDLLGFAEQMVAFAGRLEERAVEIRQDSKSETAVAVAAERAEQAHLLDSAAYGIREALVAALTGKQATS